MNALIPTLPHSLFDQDQRFAQAFTMLRDAIAHRAFPAASVAVTHRGNLVARKTLGHFVYKEDLDGAPPFSRSAREGVDFDPTSSNLFDLASLTKAVATTTMAAIFYERGLLELDAPVAGTIPEFLSHPSGASDPRRRDVSFRMLLAHSSGLPAYEKLFLKAHSRDELLHAAFATPLKAEPGSRGEYSDIGFIILGVALERIAEESLDAFCQREIFGPLAMTSTTFNPPAELRGKIPPTADEREAQCGAGLRRAVAESAPAGEKSSSRPRPNPRSTFRNRIIQGEVQDENAFVLGGVAGHAGLFSTAEDLARFAQAMLQSGADAPVREQPATETTPSESHQSPRPLLRRETVALFTRREPAPIGTSRALGWDTPSPPSQAGKHFGPRSFGHLGYTGTSLWIDPDRQLSITLLTNRTWPDCSNQAIKQVRPQFHDAIVDALGV